MKRLVVVFGFATAAALAVGFVSNSRAAPRHETSGAVPLLTMATGVINTLDPTRSPAGNNGTYPLITLGLETLTQVNQAGQIVPGLASSVTQRNATTYVYHLRHGVKFWDGNELTAADVANSLNYERYPGSQVRSDFASVKAITEVDRYTVLVVLRHADPAWRYNVSAFWASIFEKKWADAHAGKVGNPGVLFMGTGPWEFESLDPTRGAELSANPHWWGGKVPIQHISVKFFTDETSEALAFRGGNIDFAPTISNPQAFSTAAGTAMLRAPTCTQLFFSMNTQVAPWNDVHVRRAVAYAVNRNNLISANGGYASPNPTFITPDAMLADASQSQVNALLKSIPLYGYSLTKAKQELAKSKYPSGFNVTLDEPTAQNLSTVAQAFAGQLQQIGINAKVNVVGVGTWVGEVIGPAAQRPATVASGGCLNPDISGFDEFLGSKNTAKNLLNIANYAPAEIDRLIAQGDTAGTPAKLFAIYSKVVARLASDEPYVPFFLLQHGLALSSKFTLPKLGAFFNRSGALPLLIRAKA